MLAAAASLLSAPSAAQAAQAHAYSFSFASPGSEAGQLSLLPVSGTAGSGLAVNDKTHDLYVADTANNRVDQFKVTVGSSTALFIRAWGWGVADGKTEALQSCEATCFKGLAGTGPGELDAPAFVAVDNSAGASHGDVYVAATGEHLESPKNLVSKFDSEGKLIESWGVEGQLDGSSAPEGPFGQSAGIAVDSAGALWVYVAGTVKATNNHTYEFDQEGEFKGPGPADISVGYSPQGIALDSTGHLYLSENGSAVERLPPDKRVFVGTVTGLAIAPSTNDLYVDNAGSAIAEVSFQCEPSTSGCAPAQVFGAPQLSAAAGLAVDSEGVVYAANTAVGQVAVFPVSIEATIQAPSEVKATSATLRGKVDPEGSELTRCVFEYGETKAYGKSAPCEETFAAIGKGSSLVEVHAKAAGLIGGTSYHYRLRATNANGDVHSEDQPFNTLSIAVIEEASVTEVTASSAVLGAKVNPKGVPNTSCVIEYGTSTSYSASAPCEDEAPLVGTEPVHVQLHVAGLTKETTYHWRVVVKDENGTTEGADNTFVYLPPGPFEIEGGCPNEGLRGESALNPASGFALSTELPDCRAYEMVSPAQKNGALLAPSILGEFYAVGAGGERVIASSLTCFEESQSCTGDRASKGPPFEFARASGGWVTHPLAPPADRFELNSVWGYSADTGIVLFSSPVASGVTDEFYARESGGAFEGIGPIAESKSFFAIASTVRLATTDLSHVVYVSDNVLWPFDEGKSNGLYEYAGFANASPILVGVSGGQGSTDLISVCNTALGPGNSAGVRQALSRDGQIVYFTARKAVGKPCPGGSGVNKNTPVPADELYARIDGEGPGARSVLISGRSPSECKEPACTGSPAGDAFLVGASEDGTKAVFTSTQQLTDTASEDSGPDSATSCGSTSGPNGCNLYLYDLSAPAGHNLIDVSAGDSSGLGPQVQGVMAISADSSHVYFVAKGVLTAGKNRAGEEASEGVENLYVYERDGAHPAGHTAFIATLPGDEKSTPRDEEHESVEWTESLVIGANVSADGGVFLFTSHGALTADNTRGQGPAQVYRYDAASEELLRVSIGERGFNDNGNAGAGEARLASFHGVIVPARRDLSMSSDGSVVFFQSPVALTPGALSDVSVSGGVASSDQAQNIYEWEAEGRGGCTQAGGCVHLISDGRDASEGDNTTSVSTSSSVELLGADASGENVFFTTVDPLVGQDSDTELDIYDARVRGGFPAPVPAHICQGEQCKLPPPEPPPFGPLGSLTFAGPGNLTPGVVKPPVKPPTRAQRLAKALKLCRAKKNRRKRALCEREARRKYAPKHKAKKKAHKGSGKTRAHGRHK